MMMEFKRLAITAFLVLGGPGSSFAGWSSLGGETLKDKINPWFLQNTPQVRYCILHDPDNFGQGIDAIRRRVHKTLRIWQHQLGNLTMQPIGGSGSFQSRIVRLGTQEFIETHCSIEGNKVNSDNTDMVFQFGVLSGEQLQSIGNPTKYIGVTVRTDYDPINLKAKGFLYFSPERGPLKLNKVGLNKKPWSSHGGVHLFYALLHELGHVFGFQHTDVLPFMEEGFLEMDLAEGSNDRWDGGNPNEVEEGDQFFAVNFFRFEIPEGSPPQHCIGGFRREPIESQSIPQPLTSSKQGGSLFGPLTKNNGYQSVAERFFGLRVPGFGQTTHCFHFQRKDKDYQLQVFSVDAHNSKMLVGQSVNLVRYDNMFDRKNIVSIWLPKEQKVFDLGEGAPSYIERKIAIGSAMESSLFKGTYQVVGGSNSRPFFIEAKTLWRNRYGGEMDGVYYYDLFQGF